MKEERICPACGLKMRRLSAQSWTCKCRHTEKGEMQRKEKVEGKTETGQDLEEWKPRLWKDKKGKIGKKAPLSHGRKVAYKKKRTSTRG